MIHWIENIKNDIEITKKKQMEILDMKRTINEIGTSLVIQWIRIHPAMQGTQVRSLVGKLSPCTTTEPPHHNDRTFVPQKKIPHTSPTKPNE